VSEQVTDHTCNGGNGPAFGRKTVGCPRCDELLAGAAPRVGWQTERYTRSARDTRNAARARAASKAHFAPGSPHSRGACGPCCTPTATREERRELRPRPIPPPAASCPPSADPRPSGLATRRAAAGRPHAPRRAHSGSGGLPLLALRRSQQLDLLTRFTREPRPRAGAFVLSCAPCGSCPPPFALFACQGIGRIIAPHSCPITVTV